MDDALAGLAALDGVGVAAAHAQQAMDGLLRHPVVGRRPGELAAVVSVADAYASARLAGGDVDAVGAEDAGPADPLLQGALRAAAALPELARTWRSAPLQALARLHLLAGRDLVDERHLGRPSPDPQTGARLHQLLVTTGAPTTAPAVVVAGVAHAELAVLQPFPGGPPLGGLVARAAERVVLVARGADTHAVCPTSVGHEVLAARGDEALAAYASGWPAGLAAWLRHVGEAVAIAADDALRRAGEL